MPSQEQKIKARKLFTQKNSNRTMTIRELKKENDIMKKIDTNDSKEIQEMLDFVFEEGYGLGLKDGLDETYKWPEHLKEKK